MWSWVLPRPRHLAELMRASPQNRECDSFEWPPRTLSSSWAVTNFLGKTNRGVFINTLNGQLNACCDVCTERGKGHKPSSLEDVEERGNHELPGSEQLCVHRRDT